MRDEQLAGEAAWFSRRLPHGKINDRRADCASLPAQLATQSSTGPSTVSSRQSRLVAVINFCDSLGKAAQQRVASGGVELAKDVVDQKERRRPALFREELGLGELQRERSGSLLTF